MHYRVCILAAAIFAGAGAIAQTEGPGLYLFRIPSTVDAADALPAGERVELDLEVPKPGELLERLAATSLAVIAVDDRVVRVAAGRQETLIGDPQPVHRAATFVVDFDEAPVASMLEALRAQYEGQPSIAELVEFVDAGITQKSYRRGFDLASRVATSREGDCTEHAVLLTALARATDRPARVVLGIMLIAHDRRLLAFGHAWSEIHDGEGWRIADATRPERQLPDAQPRYLPLMELDNEGPGYGMQLMNLVAVYPERIDRVRTAEVSEALLQ